jgi:MoxR-like ATPase
MGPAPVSTVARSADGAQWSGRLRAEIGKAVLGQLPIIERLQIALLTGGHVLLEGMPGLAKTLLVKSLSQALGAEFERIQFTPDLLPSDVVGTMVFSPADGRFSAHHGPIFANLVLADEINRASPKTQAALLEAMEERQVTMDSTTYRLPTPFMVIATQNPVEHEGTYPLPESQLDRFLLRIRMGYPDRAAEIAMLDTHGGGSGVDDLKPVVTPVDVESMVELTKSIHVAPALKGYIIDLATATRRHPSLGLGMSPRAALALQRAARALAASQGREYVVPDDIKTLIIPVLEHRLTLAADAHIAGRQPAEILAEVLAAVPVPAGRS